MPVTCSENDGQGQILWKALKLLKTGKYINKNKQEHEHLPAKEIETG